MSDVSSSYSVEKNIQNEQSDQLSIVEIDLFEKAQQLWNGRKIIMLSTVVFLGLGVFHYVFAPEEYNSTATLIQEADSGAISQGRGFLESLAGGFNFQNNPGSLSAAARGRAPLPVSLYPVIVNSTDFQIDIIHKEFKFSNPDSTMTLFEYYRNVYEEPFRNRVYSFIGDMTIFLPVTIYDSLVGVLRSARSLFRQDRTINRSETESKRQPNEDDVQQRVADNIQVVSGPEMGVISRMRLNIALTAEGGLTTISVTLPDPLAAANVNAYLVEKLQTYITEYRIEKAKQNLEAIRRQEEEAKVRYEQAQMELASFEDQNINLSTNIAQTRVEHLRNQRNLRFQVYNSIAQEVEQARMSLEQQTPLFNILEKPNLPRSANAGSSPLRLIFSVLIGFFVGVSYVLVKSSKFFSSQSEISGS